MDTIELLKDLIRIDSSTISGANEAIEHAKDVLEKNGVVGKIIDNKGYKSYVCEIGKGDKTLVLNGHLDVVPGKKEYFEPYEKDGKLYGRGSADMKAGCAAMMSSVIKLSKQDIPCKVMLQLVSDEEDGGAHCSQYLVENGYVGDFVICTEPTFLGLSLKAKGFLRVDIAVDGKSAHGSRPWEGKNAILKAVKEYEKVLELPFMMEKSKFYNGSSVNLAIIEGGEVYNNVPDKCVIGLDIRFVPHLDPNEIIRQIKDAVDGEVEVKFIGSSVNTSPDHPYINQLMEMVKEVTATDEVEICGQHGSSDIRFFSKYNIPAVELGPSGAFWHSDGEYVDIQSMLDLQRIIEQFIMSFN
ncbi:M20/M25/M40 family metallo-hydrolase [Wukongibacter baidiensis]|uniref:M20 family metallopeptidase n=1 Tax=Wukongibacter baidiensis TaxID=1723361 RepID=UPI003D7F7801